MTTLVFPNNISSFDTKYRVTLGGREYLLRLRYNQRLERYFGELYNEDDQLVRGSVKVVTDSLMWQQSGYDEDMPDALLWPLTLSPDTSPPTLSELGKDLRVEIVVFE